jgi:hypothetical protein
MPLKSNDRPLCRLKKPNGQKEGQWQKDREFTPRTHQMCGLNVKKHARNQMADEDDDDVCGKIIGLMMKQFLPARFALICYFQERTEEFSTPAARATPKESAQHVCFE